ncbi:hypothetical protein BCR34DRAFT_541239 [Clohesyomyces aquaticus]|uniref:Prolyl 4-hydroxylase alpha subunit Fe(2+) 2OG dioxygenase domain-containing protein n=1 Tax=Clohesyomyces aquaticus TaxID=1231657 RepID=A0A1Y1ZGK9_9PLEO|nr:hypothetical protein BCR34DRAFT_541239 [Clohesyomyces aquaticus]
MATEPHSSEVDPTSESDLSELEDDDLRTQLQECLDDVQHDGDFSAMRKFHAFPTPGLWINNYGTVGLPLSTRDAESIASICKQSPFGKGSETVIDTSVRKCWEVDCADFECQNPAWTEFLDRLVKHAVEDLGVQVYARAEQYKLLLYEEGAFFKPHKDSEKVPGMFGTMVLCLPSDHSGGEVHLRHGQEKRVYATEPFSKFSMSTLAWYSDVKHEIRPVKSGYRLVITYNLVQDQNTPKQTATTLDAAHKRMGSLLRTWAKGFCHLDFFVYPLEHQYTEANLCFASLKGQDAAKGRSLQHVCGRNGVYWFIGHMTKTEHEDEYGDEDDDRVELEWLVTPTGKRVSLSLGEVQPDHTLAQDMYDDRSPDSEDEGDYTGNEAMALTCRYHDRVFVLIRKEKVFRKFWASLHQSLESSRALFELVRDDVVLQADDPEFCAGTAERILSTLMTMMLERPRPSYSYTLAYKGQDHPEDIRALFTEVAGFSDTIGRSSIVRETLQKAIKTPIWLESTEMVRLVANQVANDAAADVLQPWVNWLPPTPPGSSFKEVKQMLTICGVIAAKLNLSLVPSFDDWCKAYIEIMLRSIKTCSQDNLDALFDVIPRISPDAYVNHVLVTLAQSASKVTLVLFMHRLIATKFESMIQLTFEGLLKSPSVNFKISIDDLTSPSSRAAYPNFHNPDLYPSILNQVSSSHSTSNEVKLPPFITDVFSIIMHATNIGLRKEAGEQLLLSFPELPNTGNDFWKGWRCIFKYVEGVITILEHLSVDDVQNKAKSFISAILEQSVRFLERRRPVPPKDWRRISKKWCGCAAASALKAFLDSPDQSVGHFQYGANVRKHLQQGCLLDRDYIFDTKINRGKQSTLIIRKTNNEYERCDAVWRADDAEMQIGLRKLRLQISKGSLKGTFAVDIGLGNLVRPIDAPPYTKAPPPAAGPQGPQFPAAFGLHNPSSNTASQNPQTLLPMRSPVQNSRAPPAVAGAKRKADVADSTKNILSKRRTEVIDLTEGAED